MQILCVRTTMDPKPKKPAKPSEPAGKWTAEHENILVEWADKAACYRWLHGKCHTHYRRSNYWFTLPVIIMSTLTGTANFAQDRFSDDIKPWVAVGIGGVNIIAGILTTIQQFLKISELNEAHRVSSIAWDKFYRNTKVELAKAPKERTNVLQQLKASKEEFDRLMETSPAISDKVIATFNEVFSGTATREQIAADMAARRAAFTQLKKPEICDTIETTGTAVYRPPERPPPPSPTAAADAAAAAAAASREAQKGTRALAAQAFRAERGRPPSEIELTDMIREATGAAPPPPDAVHLTVSDLPGVEDGGEHVGGPGGQNGVED